MFKSLKTLYHNMRMLNSAALTNPRFWEDVMPIASHSGEHVSPDTAMRTAAVYSCVRVLSNGISSLPFHLKLKQNGIRTDAADHPLYRLVHLEPNPDMDATQFWRTFTANMAKRGQGDAFKVMTRSGRITELRLLDPDSIEIKRDKANKITFEVHDGFDRRAYSPDFIFHVPLFTDDGVIGISPIRQCMNSVGALMAAERFSGSFFRNGMRPSAILESDDAISKDKEQRKAVVEAIREEFTGAANAGKVVMLTHGIKAKTIAITPEEAQYIETRKFDKREIAAIYGVPPHKIADLEDAHHANIEEQNIDWVNDGLMPYATSIESAATRQLLGESEKSRGYYFKFNFNGLLRGNSESRSKYYSEMRQNGAINANEIRELEDMNPIQGDAGETYWMPVNMTDSENPVMSEPPQSQTEPVANSNGNGRHNLS